MVDHGAREDRERPRDPSFPSQTECYPGVSPQQHLRLRARGRFATDRRASRRASSRVVARGRAREGVRAGPREQPPGTATRTLTKRRHRRAREAPRYRYRSRRNSRRGRARRTSRAIPPRPAPRNNSPRPGLRPGLRPGSSRSTPSSNATSVGTRDDRASSDRASSDRASSVARPPDSPRRARARPPRTRLGTSSRRVPLSVFVSRVFARLASRARRRRMSRRGASARAPRRIRRRGSRARVPSRRSRDDVVAEPREFERGMCDTKDDGSNRGGDERRAFSGRGEPRSATSKTVSRLTSRLETTIWVGWAPRASAAMASARAVPGMAKTSRWAWRVTPAASVSAAAHASVGSGASWRTSRVPARADASWLRFGRAAGGCPVASGGAEDGRVVAVRASTTSVMSSTDTRVHTSPAASAPCATRHRTTSPDSHPTQNVRPQDSSASALADTGRERAPSCSRSAKPPTSWFRSARATARSASRPPIAGPRARV